MVVDIYILYVHPYLGRWWNLTHIFQMSWNHQLDKKKQRRKKQWRKEKMKKRNNNNMLHDTIPLHLYNKQVKVFWDVVWVFFLVVFVKCVFVIWQVQIFLRHIPRFLRGSGHVRSVQIWRDWSTQSHGSLPAFNKMSEGIQVPAPVDR